MFWTNSKGPEFVYNLFSSFAILSRHSVLDPIEVFDSHTKQSKAKQLCFYNRIESNISLVRQEEEEASQPNATFIQIFTILLDTNEIQIFL